MSTTSKAVTSYAKSLFRKGNVLSESKVNDSTTISKITSASQKSVNSDIFLLGEELLLTRAILISSSKVKSFFENPTYPEYQKLDILLTIFPGLSLTMQSFLKFLTERGHLSLIPAISDEYNMMLLKFKNSTKAKLIIASELNKDFGLNLLQNLKNITKANEILLTVTYNPKILGGLILEYDSVAIDASILKEFSLFFDNI